MADAAEEDDDQPVSAISKEKFMEMKNAIDKDGDGEVTKVRFPSSSTIAIICSQRRSAAQGDTLGGCGAEEP